MLQLFGALGMVKSVFNESLSRICFYLYHIFFLAHHLMLHGGDKWTLCWVLMIWLSLYICPRIFNKTLCDSLGDGRNVFFVFFGFCEPTYWHNCRKCDTFGLFTFPNGDSVLAFYISASVFGQSPNRSICPTRTPPMWHCVAPESTFHMSDDWHVWQLSKNAAQMPILFE